MKPVMRVPLFVVAVLLAALLVVGSAYIAERCGARPATTTDNSVEIPELRAFVPDGDPTGGLIECLIASGSGVAETFSSPAPRCWLQDGWSSPRQWGRWVKRSVARFELHLATPADGDLILGIRPAPGLPKDAHQTMELRVNGARITDRRLRRRLEEIRLPIPEGALRSGRNELTLSFSLIVPAVKDASGRATISKAAGIFRIAFATGDGTRSASRLEVGSEALVVYGAGTLVLPMLKPAGAETLRLDLRAELGSECAAGGVRLTVAGLDGEPERRLDLSLPPGKSLTPVRITLADLHGNWAMVRLHSTTEDARLEVSNLRFSGADTSLHSSAIPQPDTTGKPSPNIVWITLDAARADHFGFAGYHRDTTPFIDSIARKALVFSNAYSLVPYTLCSVPTMISGLSFLDHDVVGHEDVLSPEATTLAERLRESGYLTAAFSANPNNSRAKGFDQGYDVFREMWTEGELNVTRRAPYIAARVAEWLDTVENDQRPLHLQVHILPPHAPYDPPPVFNRYTDAGFDGPCDGWPRTIFDLENGLVEATPACIDHLTALYDGNLNVADDAVRTIVEALRGRPRWKDTVLLITSDHGEAFMEHGHQGHNSTLFTEMVRVPFVLRMPDGFDPATVDTEGLATVADIVPTLLSTAGIAPLSPVEGVFSFRPSMPGTRVMTGTLPYSSASGLEYGRPIALTTVFRREALGYREPETTRL